MAAPLASAREIAGAFRHEYWRRLPETRIRRSFGRGLPGLPPRTRYLVLRLAVDDAKHRADNLHPAGLSRGTLAVR